MQSSYHIYKPIRDKIDNYKIKNSEFDSTNLSSGFTSVGTSDAPASVYINLD